MNMNNMFPHLAQANQFVDAHEGHNASTSVLFSMHVLCKLHLERVQPIGWRSSNLYSRAEPMCSMGNCV